MNDPDNLITLEEEKEARLNSCADLFPLIDVWEANPDIVPRLNKRQADKMRWALRRVVNLRPAQIKEMSIDNLADLDWLFSPIAQGKGVTHRFATRLCREIRKILDHAWKSKLWSCETFDRIRAWDFAIKLFEGHSKGCLGIVDFAIALGRYPDEFSDADTGYWELYMLCKRRSIETVDIELQLFRAVLRNSGVAGKFPKLNLKSRKPTAFSAKPAELRGQVPGQLKEIETWLLRPRVDDRPANFAQRPSSVKHLIAVLLELIGYRIHILKLACLSLLDVVNEEFIDSFIKWKLGKNLDLGQRGVVPDTLITALHRVVGLTSAYKQLFTDADYDWLGKLVRNIKRETQEQLTLTHEALAIAAKKIHEERSLPVLTLKKQFWLCHDELVIRWPLDLPWRAKNLAKCGLKKPFRAINVKHEPLPPLATLKYKLPTWAKMKHNRDPLAEFWWFSFGGNQTKTHVAFAGLIPLRLARLLEEYRILRERLFLDLAERALTDKGLAKRNITDPGSLFANRHFGAITVRNLLNRVSTLSVKYAGQRITTHILRDLYAGWGLGSGEKSEDVANALFQVRLDAFVVYTRTFNASNGAVRIDKHFGPPEDRLELNEEDEADQTLGRISKDRYDAIMKSLHK
jgi:hypothetical protein